MTNIFFAGESLPVDLLAQTEGFLRDAAEGLVMAVRAVQAGEGGDGKDVQHALGEFRKSFQHVMDERARVEKYRKTYAGTGAGQSLDFGAARDEIQRRLACLRAATDD